MLAIIPARGGSKGVHKKNIKEFSGKPLIFWTIEAAIKSKNIDKIILSTNDYEIVEACSIYKELEVPFMRPDELAEDTSLAVDTYIFTIEKLKEDQNIVNDNYVVLLPTSPLRIASDIDGAITLFREKNADSVISCKKLDFPKEWIINVDEKNRILKDQQERIIENRQQQKEIYIPNGSIYILNHDLVKNYRTYYFDKTFAYLMPNKRSVDIDTEDDFFYAEFINNN